MEHDLELFIPDPGNIWKFVFFYFPISWKYWKSDFSSFSHILEILEVEVCNILHNLEIRAAGGRLRGLCCAALDYFWNMFPGISGYPGNIGNMIFLIFGIFTKKTRAEISRRMVRFMGRDLSYETDSGPKTKTVSDPNFQDDGGGVPTLPSGQSPRPSRPGTKYPVRGQSLTSIIRPSIGDKTRFF